MNISEIVLKKTSDVSKYPLSAVGILKFEVINPILFPCVRAFISSLTESKPETYFSQVNR